MSNQRLAVNNEGVGAEYATYEIDAVSITYSATVAGGSSQVGLAVTLTDDNTIATAADGEEIEGKLIKVEADGWATVQVGGYMTLPAGTSASLTNGKKIVGDLLVSAEGYIREVNTATAAELGLCRGRIIDNSTTTAVVVCL